ncbi:putative glycosyltransferase EpsJ [Aliarcobacter thereius]|uniref:Putative glycosyltransferase EpsJ n=1 Tax=Aliarcobacter thereius TaxID=544718 RepID=A0A1C0B6P7_9BACT|nr:glycosyltransferase [Aliarcobacter thereius]OCL99251.1 putative glycosyltransferase EpsJ [Aliarcobacter thereius]
MSKISVLIPTYKPQEYIEKCFDSIEKQTLSKEFFKVYIALNGDRNPYYEYIESLLTKYSFKSEFIYLEEIGVSNARNKLIDISKEPFITFIDDDDIISENYLENLLEIADENYISIANVYNFEKDINEKKENYIGNCFLSLNNIEKSKYKTRKYFSSPCAKLINRKMIGDVRFDTKLKIGEDSLFMAEISNKVEGLKKTTEDTIYYVFERAGSATRKKIDKKEEFKRIIYLVGIYIKMLFGNYNKIFIMTRIAATMKHLKNIFKETVKG